MYTQIELVIYGYAHPKSIWPKNFMPKALGVSNIYKHINYKCIMEIGCSRFWIVLLNWKRDRWCWNIQSFLLQWYWWVSTENFLPFSFGFWPHQCFLGAWTGGYAVWTIGWVVGYIGFLHWRQKLPTNNLQKANFLSIK
jgi:hypothetical protein